MTTRAAERLDAAFAALADPTRRAIVSRLARGDATVTELAAPFAMSLPAVSKHLKVLERSGLISRRRDAQFRPCHLEARRSTARSTGSPRTGGCGTSASTSSTRCRPLRARPEQDRPADERNGRIGRERADADGPELRFSRVFDAPRELVFRCMTDPDHLTHFWGPTGVSAPRDRITVDARPGGVFETVMVNDADGSEYPTRAVFDEVRAPELLVWTESHSGMRVRSEFVALGPRTHRGAGSTRPTCPRRSWPPRPRPGSSPRSTGSPRISPRARHVALRPG